MKKHLKGDNLEQRLRDVRDVLAGDEEFTLESTERAVRELAERSGLGAGKYIHPLRVALVGKSSSPPIFDVALALGRASALARLDHLIARLDELTGPQP